MTNRKQLLLPLILLLIPAALHAQAWSGILDPARAIDWTKAGVPGGIPSGSWTQSGATIAAGASTATIQTALNACGTNQYVLLGSGKFLITSLSIPSNCVLRGSGTLNTILNTIGTSGAAIALGTAGVPFNPASTTTNITSGATAGSTHIGVASASGISVGTYLEITELNDPSYVTIVTPNGICTWCSGTGDSGARARGQIVEVTNVSGSTITFFPALYSAYGVAPGTSPAQATHFAASAKFAGVENLQVYANGTGYGQTFSMNGCAYCWVKGVFNNYTDGDHVDIYWGFHDEIRDSYFSNAYLHVPGVSDSEIDLANKTSETLVENNIIERLHAGIMLEWGAAGNVIAYNYEIGNFDSGAINVILAFINFHGAHPQFNLFEGNIGNNITMDAFWGSGANNTTFRNNFRGTDTLASPETAGRNVVNWSSTTLVNQQMMGEQLAFPHTNVNSVGNVLGSADAATRASGAKYNSGASPFTSTIIPPATRNYDNFFSAVSVGYDTGSDTNGSSVANFQGGFWVGKASRSIFQHGNFDIASNSIIWNGSTTQTLPTSFYRSSKPSWFGSAPWPPIGPDVTGGNVDATTLQGHVYAIPAERCYNNTTRDATGIKLFDPTACYLGSTSSSAPAAPTGLTVTVH